MRDDARLQLASEYLFRLERLGVRVVDRDGALSLEGPARICGQPVMRRDGSLGLEQSDDRLAVVLSRRLRQRIRELEPELRSILGWREAPEHCCACGSREFHRRADGTWGCSGCFHEAAELLDNPGPPVTLAQVVEGLDLTPVNAAARDLFEETSEKGKSDGHPPDDRGDAKRHARQVAG